MGLVKEFQEFISRGSVIDLAVGVVMGTAFTAIVNSLVNDIIMPFVGVLLGGVDFSSLSLQVGEATIAYGNFIQALINFLIIALVIFLSIRSINQLHRRMSGPEEEEAPAEPPAEERLLREIRDLLQAKTN